MTTDIHKQIHRLLWSLSTPRLLTVRPQREAAPREEGRTTSHNQPGRRRPAPNLASPHGGMTVTTCRTGRGSCAIEPCEPLDVESPSTATLGPVTNHGAVNDGQAADRGEYRGAWHLPRGGCWAGSRTFSHLGGLHRRMGLERNAA